MTTCGIWRWPWMPSEGSDALICCGDLCSPFVIDELAKIRARDSHRVRKQRCGPVPDHDQGCSRSPNVHIHGEFFEASLDGKRFAVNHFDTMARPMAKSGRLRCGLLRAQSRVRDLARTRMPADQSRGPWARSSWAQSFSGKGQDVTPTFVIYDTALRLTRGKPAAIRHAGMPRTRTIQPDC